MRKFLTIISAVLLLASCQKEIDFEYREIDPITVIEGNLTTEYASVIINETTAVDEPMNRTHFTDAKVTITDLTDGTFRTLHPDEDGVFTDGLTGVPGHSYRLSVERNGYVYESDCEMLMPVQIVDFGFKRVSTPMGHLIVGQVAFLDNPLTRGDCYIVRFFRNGELYSWGTISDIQAVDNVMLSSFKVIDQADLPDDAHQDDGMRDNLLNPGDELEVVVVPVSRRYFDYLVALNQGSNGPLLFSATPLNSSSAIASSSALRSSSAALRSSSHSTFCLGYFLAAPESKSTAVYNPDEL